MKRLLLFLCLAGAAVYVLTPPRAVPDGEVGDISAGQTQANHPAGRQLRSSWGSTLQSLRQEPRAPLANSQEPASTRQNAAYGPRRYEEKNQGSERTLGAYDPAASVAKTSAPAIDKLEQEPVEWAKVVLAARAHSEASVSSPIVRFYRPGTEVQVVRWERGWFQLSDPVTQERGWVFEKYLVSIDGPSPMQAAMESTAEPPSPKAALPKAKKQSRSAKPAVRVADEVTKRDRRRGRWARRGDRRRGLGLFGFRGRKAAPSAWSIGPAR
jgi:hypothetical protein